MPAYLAIVPLSVQLDTPLKKQAEVALPMLEAIEQRAATQGVPVDSRIEPGRSVRHAFRRLMEHERFDRVVAAGATNGDGFSSDDVAWLLENAPGTVLIIRPGRPSDKPMHPAVVSQNGSGADARRASQDLAAYTVAREIKERMTLSSRSSSGCQRTPSTNSPSEDSIASTLSSSVAQALAVRLSGIESTPWW